MHEAKRIFVTGGAGFIGANFVRQALAERSGVEVVNYDLLTYAGNLENLEGCLENPRHRFVRGDVCDGPAVRSAMEGCDCVVHLAAETHVDRSILDSAPFVRTNVLGTQAVLDAARACGIARVIIASTDEVYGALALTPGSERFTESSPLNPSSPYAASKAAGDLLAQAQQRTHGGGIIVTRCTNNFGPYQFPEKLIPFFIARMLRGESAPLYGDGLHVRDWIHVADHCSALLAILERGRAGRIYNISADNQRSNLELARTLANLLGRDESCLRFVADRPGHDRRYALDASRLRTEVGWRPTRSEWPDGLVETVKWYRDNEEWLARVMDGSYREYVERWYGGRM